MKPSSSTDKNTNAPAGSNRTKSYGNGQSAGQIAIGHGYPATGNLYGPGNSQPHKAVPCGHKHGVDVHALKSHAHAPKGDCSASPHPPHPNPRPHPTPNPPGPPAQPNPPASSPGGTTPGDPGHTPTHGHAHNAGHSSSPARALAAVAHAGGAELPFTGIRLGLVVLCAIALVVSGAALRARGRVPARS